MSSKKEHRFNMGRDRDRRDSISKAEARLFNMISENLLNLRSIWDQIGMDEEQRNARIAVVIDHAESLFVDMVIEESDMAEKLVEAVKEHKEEISYLSKELNCVQPEMNVQESLVDAESNLRFMVEELRIEKHRRMKIYKQLFDEDVDICKQMNVAVYSIAPNLVPTERQLNELKFHIEQNRRDRDYRQTKVAEFKTKIIRIMSKLALKPKTDMEKRIVAESVDALPLTSDFLRDLETLLSALQNRFDVYLDSVRRQFGHLKEKLENLWTLCHVSQSTRDLFQHVNEEDFDEDALDRYNAELTRWEGYYRERREILDKVDAWIRLWNEKLEYESKDLDSNRFFNRGGALLVEEKERKKLEKRLPMIEREIKIVVGKWNAIHPRQPFLIEGHPVLEHLDRIQKDYLEKKEKEKLGKQMAKKNKLEAERLYGASPLVTPNGKRNAVVVRRILVPNSRNKENTGTISSKASSHTSLAATMRSPANLHATVNTVSKPLASKPPHLPRPETKSSFRRRAEERAATLAKLNRVDESASASNASSESYDAFVQNIHNQECATTFAVIDTPSPAKAYQKIMVLKNANKN